MGFWLVVDVLGTAVALAVLVTAFVLDPHPSGHGTVPALFQPCSHLTLTGKPCPSCGMTTCFVNLAHARPVAAWNANPAGILLFLLTVAAPPWLIHAAVTQNDPLRFVRHRVGGWVLPAVVVGIVVSWMIRVV